MALVAGGAVALTAVTGSAAAATEEALADPGATSQDFIAAADRHLNATANAGQLRRGSGDAFVRTGVHDGTRGLKYVSYERTYRGLPVIGGDVVVSTNELGHVLSTSVAQSAAINVGTSAKVSATDAAAKSRTTLTSVAATSAPRLVVYAWGAQPALAWETVVDGLKADEHGNMVSRNHVFVDATSGAILGSYDEVSHGTGTGYYNGTVTIGTSGSGSSWSMQDSARPGIRCGGQNGATFTGTDDVWGNGSGTNLETACVDVLYAVGKEWDMLGSWLGRNGINGSGGGYPARVGLAQVNAYWNGSYTNFGRSQDGQRQVTPIDVVAHEYGHAIFQTTPGGSGGSSNETGGINEATGDIFGALTEYYANNPNDPPDFLVGEEVNLVGSGPIRNMYNPSALGDPNCYSSSIPNTEVHAAAGPLNHWFYLVSQGSAGSGGSPASPTCNGSTVTGIGIQKAGLIYYNAMLAKVSGWRHAHVRVASLNAAKNLYPNSCVEFNTVLAAWNAISVPAQSGEPTCSSSTNNFSVSVSPTSASVTAGSSTSATVSTALVSGANQSVTFSASGLPSGASASFNPASVTTGGSSTMTISTSASTPNGTYTVTVTGTGTSATRTATFSLTVTGGPSGSCSGTNGTDVSIPDNNTYVYSDISISGCGRAPSTTSTVAVNIVHTYRGDLQIALIAPDGTVYSLKTSNSSDSADNVNATYTGNLSSESANGTWRLRVRDVFSVDTGYINTWTLTL
jgi:Zn-dependent metalloprotease